MFHYAGGGHSEGGQYGEYVLHQYFPDTYEDQILKYVPSDDKWERVGTMKNQRIWHSVAVINVKDYCHTTTTTTTTTTTSFIPGINM